MISNKSVLAVPPHTLLRWVLLGSCALLVPAAGPLPTSRADETVDLGAAVNDLFNKYWDARSTRDQDAGDDEYLRQSAKILAWEYRYAQTLVQIAQYRTAAARDSVRQLLKHRSEDWRLHRANAWTSLASRDYPGGLLALDQWVKALPPEDPAMPNDLEGLEAATDIGSMFGFLEVAAHKPIDAGVSERYSRRWKLLLSKSRWAAFENGRQRVKQQHADLLGLREKTVKDGKAKATKEKEEKLQSLDKQQADIARESEQLQKTMASLQDQLKAELAAIERQDGPLRAAMGRLDGQAIAMNRDLAIITSDIARLQRRLDRERDPFVRSQIRADLRRLDAIAARRDLELLAAERELDGLATQRQSLLLRQRRAQADLGGELQSASKKINDLTKLDRRLSSQQQRVLRTSPGTSGSARAMAARAAIIATYVTFPLAEEKRRLLQLTAP